MLNVLFQHAAHCTLHSAMLLKKSVQQQNHPLAINSCRFVGSSTKNALSIMIAIISRDLTFQIIYFKGKICKYNPRIKNKDEPSSKDTDTLDSMNLKNSNGGICKS